MTTRLLVLVTAVVGMTLYPAAQQQKPMTEINLATFDVPAPEGTALARLRNTYTQRRAVLPETDLQDQSPLPIWFRAFVRESLPELPREGTYQYPRVAVQLLDWMVAHPDLEVPAAARAAGPRGVAARGAARALSIGADRNISNTDERHSESFIGVDCANPQYVVAGSNNITGSGQQKQFYSSDGGASWASTELPLAQGASFHSDPTVAFASNGTAWATTLGISGPNVTVQVYRSIDHGATWSFVSTVSGAGANDKEMMWIDTHAASPHRDNIYLAWDVVGQGVRFVRSTTQGTVWSPVQSLSTDTAIGAHLTSGPAGEVYVAWPDTTSRELRIRRSTDGGATFGAARVIATTNDSYEISIPAFCRRKVLIYVSIDVDRSGGPRKGTVYATWTDRNGSQADPGCSGTTSASNANVYFASSSDGGQTWSAPKIVHADTPASDQFNQWMYVSPKDGSIHVIYYNTGDDSSRLTTNLYYASSEDGGATWLSERKVSTASTDETATSADLMNQYGDYNGLSGCGLTLLPSWTDRRASNPGGKEQIYTAQLVEPPMILTICRQQPNLCFDAVLRPNEVLLACARKPCLVVDPIPKNCTVKYSCPGCRPGALCPPFYHLTFEGPDLALFDVFLVNETGRKVGAVWREGDRVVVSFRPSKEKFREGRIGNYFMAFELKPDGETGREYRLKAKVETGNRPYSRPSTSADEGTPR